MNKLRKNCEGETEGKSVRTWKTIIIEDMLVMISSLRASSLLVGLWCDGGAVRLTTTGRRVYTAKATEDMAASARSAIKLMLAWRKNIKEEKTFGPAPQLLYLVD